MAGQPAGIPGPEPVNRPNQYVAVCWLCLVQLRARTVATDDWPGATVAGAKANEVICTVHPVVVLTVAAEAPTAPAATSPTAMTIDAIQRMCPPSFIDEGRRQAIAST